ncbi:MAG: DUF2812 domain-containing protein [Solibacillus sp.]|uniref:DUF2812 domain-containing protein n=1 Tax=Solibacillus sp. TaxID=1909654 RepID=UPI003316199F
MGNFIRKIRIDEFWRIAEQEVWFQEMSAKGFHLKKLGKYLVTFVKGEKSDVYYKIEPSNWMNLSTVQLEKSEQLGFEYVTNYTVYFTTYHVFSTTNEHAKEQSIIDREVQLKAFETVKKWTRNTIFITFIPTLLLSAIFVAFLFRSEASIYHFVVSEHILFFILVGYILMSLPTAYISMKSISQYSLEQLNSITTIRSSNKKKRRWVLIIGFLSYLLLMTALAFMPIVQIIKMDTKTMPAEAHDLPIIPLADIEQNANLRRESSDIWDEVDWNNRYSVEWSILAPIQYKSNQALIDDQSSYRPYMSYEVYQLQFAQLTALFMDDLIERNEYRVEKKDFTKINDRRFNQLLVYNNGLIKTIVAVKGKAVAYIDYNGQAVEEIILDQLSNRLSTISE